jgi:hypothetical protein
MINTKDLTDLDNDINIIKMLQNKGTLHDTYIKSGNIKISGNIKLTEKFFFILLLKKLYTLFKENDTKQTFDEFYTNVDIKYKQWWDKLVIQQEGKLITLSEIVKNNDDYMNKREIIIENLKQLIDNSNSLTERIKQEQTGGSYDTYYQKYLIYKLKYLNLKKYNKF